MFLESFVDILKFALLLLQNDRIDKAIVMGYIEGVIKHFESIIERNDELENNK